MIRKYKIFNIIIVTVLLVALYISSYYNYLLFHSLAEMFSIVIAVAIYIIAWNTRRYINNPYLILLGIAYLFIAFLDLLHTLGYTGMGIFTSYDYYGNMLWIGTRYIESLTLLAGFVLLKRKIKPKPYTAMAIYSLVTIVLLLSIFWWDIFPACFIPGQGQTQFKIISELVICTILLLAVIMLWHERKSFEKRVYQYLFYSILFTIGSELAFAYYINNYGISNLVGHYLKLFSFYLIYKAIVETGLTKPYKLIFYELQQTTKSLRIANATKSKFFSIISHDLRNPLSGLIGLSKLLVTQNHQLSSEQIQDYQQLVYKASTNLSSLLSNLLSWAMSQQGLLTPKPERIDLQQIVATNLNLLSQNINDKNLKVDSPIEPETYAFADQNMVDTVIRNLLTNAIKFTPDGGQISITGKVNQSVAALTVQDTGIGMTQQALSNLFRPDKVKSCKGTKGEQGSGLGLMLCHDFALANKGKLSVTSVKDKGSSFTIELPTQKPD